VTLTITEVQHRFDDFELEPEVVEGLWRMEQAHFWHSARNHWILRGLRQHGVAPGARILEVGCGSGAVAGYLQRAGYRVTGVDTAEMLVRKADERCPEATFIVGDVAKLDRSIGSFAAICFFDVLEHLQAPTALVQAATAFADGGALVMATVPAQSALHTVIDDLSGHKKRYEQGELGALLGDSGLHDIEERGIFRLTVPILRRFRADNRDVDAARLSGDEKKAIMIRNCRIPSAPVNLAMRWLCALERWLGWSASRNKPGASLLATARV
jgi:SAM-dependent methyltransferase